jgi:hypothetical protein
VEQEEIEQGINEIRRLASYVVQEFQPISRVNFGYNAESVEWVEEFIERERCRRDLSKGIPEGLVNTLGSFLGECIVAANGGNWEWSEEQQDWGIRFEAGDMAFPFEKVWKQFTNGVEGGDSIESFYRITVEYVAPGKLRNG